jgi:hypothetical protein
VDDETAEAIVTDVRRTYFRYIELISEQLRQYLMEGVPYDSENFCWWSFPLLDIGESPPRILAKYDFELRLTPLYERYFRDEGWSTNRIDSTPVWPVSENLAMLEGHGSRHRDDGSVIDGWDCYYAMRRFRDEWRCMVLAPASGAPSYPRPTQWRSWLARVAELGG